METEKKEILNNNVQHHLRQMEVGDKLFFAPERVCSIYTETSRTGFMLNRKFKVRANRQQRVVEVTRLS